MLDRVVNNILNASPKYIKSSIFGQSSCRTDSHRASQRSEDEKQTQAFHENNDRLVNISQDLNARGPNTQSSITHDQGSSSQLEEAAQGYCSSDMF